MDDKEFERLQKLARSKGLDLNYHYETQEAKEEEEPDSLILETLDRKGFNVEYKNGQNNFTYSIVFDIEDTADVEDTINQYTKKESTV